MADPKLCWSCGEQGTPQTGTRMICGACEVTWMQVAQLTAAAETGEEAP